MVGATGFCVVASGPALGAGLETLIFPLVLLGCNQHTAFDQVVEGSDGDLLILILQVRIGLQYFHVKTSGGSPRKGEQQSGT